LATATFLILLGAGSIAFGPERVGQPLAAMQLRGPVAPAVATPRLIAPAQAATQPSASVVAPAHGARDLIIPIDGIAPGDLVDSFGAAREGGRAHEGIDIMAPAGTPVRAAATGTILKLFTSNLGGVTLYQADASGALVLYYAHLMSYAPGVREGRRVRQGEVIGYVGQSGNATVPHLHFEVHAAAAERQWWRGRALNPYLALKAGRVDLPMHAALGGQAR
jgi:murein DD-endopeptidase MepM/ murein hydrolase activator NlpD